MLSQSSPGENSEPGLESALEDDCHDDRRDILKNLRLSQRHFDFEGKRVFNIEFKIRFIVEILDEFALEPQLDPLSCICQIQYAKN